MPLDRALLKKECAEGMNRLFAENVETDPFKQVFLDAFGPRITKKQIEEIVVTIAKTVWNAIENKQDSHTIQLKITHRTNIDHQCANIVSAFFEKVYGIISERKEILERNNSSNKFPAFAQSPNREISSCIWTLNWESNPNLIAYPKARPIMPRSSFPKEPDPFYTFSNADREKGVFCDVIFKVNDQEFPAHRLILAAQSPVFKALFTSGMQESQQRMIELQEDKTHFALFLNALYTQNPVMPCSELNDLFVYAELANKYQATRFLQWYEWRIADVMNDRNFYLIASYAVGIGSVELIKQCEWYFTVYKGSIPQLDLKSLSLAEIGQYLEVGSVLKDRILEEACQDVIKTRLQCDTFAEICQMAIVYAKRKQYALKQLCDQYAQEHGQELQTNEMKEAKQLYIQLMTGVEENE